MTTQAVREKLVEEVENKILKQLRHVAKTGEDWPEGGERWTKTASRAIVDLIAEGLEDVTEEMDRAGEAVIPPAWPRRVDLAAAVFRAMLSASVVGKINTNPKAIAAIVANLRDGQALPSSGRSSLAAFLEALSAERGQLSARLAACERERDEARAENAWRPIESAPRNGGQILAWGPTNSSVAAYFWAQGRWQASHEGNGIIENQSDFGTNYKSESEGTLTIWKQLPEPPK